MPLGQKATAIFMCAALLCASAATIAAVINEPQLVTVRASELDIDSSQGLRIHEGRPFTGIAKEFHPDGSVAKADSFVDGLRHGASQLWFASGQLGYEAHFIEGIREGVAKTWWANGKLRSKTTYVADRQNGEAWVWYSSGEKYKRHFYREGAPEGLQQAWRKNGKLFENFEVRGGRTYGLRNSKICVEVKSPDA